MGPVECQLKERAQAIHSRLMNSRPPMRIEICDETQELMSIINGLKQQLVKAKCDLMDANAEIEKLKPKIYPHPVHTIIEMVSKREKVPKIDLLSSRRTAAICMARHIAYYLSATTTTFSTPQIGLIFGGRDHTSVLHGRNKIKTIRLFDEVMDARLRWYEEQLAAVLPICPDKRGA